MPETPAPPEGTFAKSLSRKQARLREEQDKARKTDNAVSTAQGSLMIVHRLLGKSIAEIGEIFQVGPDTVKKKMSLAEKAGMLDLAQELVTKRLMPKALAVYEAKLMEGDLDAARDVLFGAGVLEKNSKLRVSAEVETLDSWKSEYFRTSLPGEVVKDEEIE